MLLPLTLAGLLAPSAVAASPVLVAPFQGRTPASRAEASRLSSRVEEALQAAGVSVMPVSSLPRVSDLDPLDYGTSCPTAQFVGCAYVLGEAGNVTLTVAGVVETQGPLRRAEIHILDLRRSEDVLAFEASFGVADEDQLASALAQLVASVVRGEGGLVGDIREMDDPNADAEADRERAVAAAQLESLSREIGGADAVGILDEGEVVREKLKVEDLSEQIASEAAKPWERLGMRVNEYVKYRNSDLSLSEWRDLVAGRRGQLVLRGGLGWATGPSNGGYYFLEAKSATDLQVVETWSWANATAGQGLNWEVDVAYGLFPALEVGLIAGGLTGQYSVQSWNFTEGQRLSEPDPAQTSNSVVYVGPQVLVALLPTSPVRPVVGGEVRYWLGTSVLDHVESAALPSGAPTFEDTWMVTAGGRLGAEATVGEGFDIYLHAPVTLLVAGRTVARRQSGDGYIEDPVQPGRMARLGAGVQAGVQLRFFGGAKKPKAERFDVDPD